MDLSTKTNDELAAGLGEHLREAERRAAAEGHTLIGSLLGAAHKILELAETIAHESGHVAARGGGTDKETPPA